MLEVPVFLYQVMYVLFASMIPVVIILYMIRVLMRQGKKTYRTTFK